MTTLSDRLRHPALIQHVPAATREAFERFLAEEPDRELHRMNPLDYGRQHGLSDREALDLFLHAARAGLVNMEWYIVCPRCGGILHSGDALARIASQQHCIICNLPTEVILDEAIEVAFTVVPAVRDIRHHARERMSLEEKLAAAFTYHREVEPRFAAHIDSLIRSCGSTARGETESLVFDLDAGSYRFIDLQIHEALAFEVGGPPTGAPQPLRIDLQPGTLTASTQQLRPGPVALEVVSHRDALGVWSLNRAWSPPAWWDDANPARPKLTGLTGKRLLTSQTFRDLFRAERLDPGSSLGLRSMSFLFTDLKGSTALYERIGDLRAYDLVQEHFGLLGRIAVEHDGAIVKTIGDAVMAAFPDPVRAASAAAAMHRNLARWNVGRGSEELTLKVGLHEGPCIAVESNDRLDYFGQTVNLAARLQGLADAREVCLSCSMHVTPGVPEILAQAGATVTEEQVRVKGVSQEVQVVRARFA